MKNLIYISLIAIIVLSGCKGNAFLSKKYTRFSVSKGEHTIEKPLVKVNKKVQLPKETIAENKVQERVLSSADDALQTILLAPKQEPLAINHHSKSLVQTPVIISDNKVIEKESGNTHIKTKKTVKEKSQSIIRIIGTVLKLVLYIVILAIIVGIIILVVIL